MALLTEVCRGTVASARWLLGAPWLSYNMAYRASDKDEARALIRAHCARFQRTCRFDVVQDGPAPVPGQGCVIVYNETSFIDSIAYANCLLPHIDRGSLTDLYGLIPFARKGMKNACIEMVPRGRRERTDRLLDFMVERVAAGERVAWGGEGRITGQDGIARYKVGSSLIAIRAQVPLVPVVFHGGHQIMPLRSLRARPGTVRVRFGTPIPTKGVAEATARDLADRLQREAARIYAELKDEAAAAARTTVTHP